MIKRRKKIHVAKRNAIKFKPGLDTEPRESTEPPAADSAEPPENAGSKSYCSYKVANFNQKSTELLPEKFTMRPSEFSPLPVGIVESDPETKSDSECSLPVAKKRKLNTAAKANNQLANFPLY